MRRREWMLYSSASLLTASLAVSLAGPAAAQGKSATAAKADAPRRILVLGDSLSAEYGLARGTGWVALMTQRLNQQQLPAEVINASISGDTTSGGLARLPALLKQHQPTLLVIELGGNDALRGLPLANTRDNLRAMVRAGKAAGAKVLLVGMQIPPNMGPSYTREFEAGFKTVAQEEKVPLVPFLLAGVADRSDAADWFQPDRIHPLAKAHPVMLENVWKQLRPML
ncbi:acyl-CoA thioesterase-1 [Roseateles depolymerans]|uniref:Arylesterase n=2 Tax=Roseateles depolymerans TaxID=76731 RepID=A0A0U3MBY2_9BURK|nr:Arylesterase [Roseateles depolymerans]REG12862.1 acyl-CoA thioesterase-1 [Roseateles depolymerans]